MKRIHMRIEELLGARGISKNQICKDLDIPRGNFNRYCRDEFQRIDANLVVKLCGYLNCELQELLEIVEV
ncbi:MAG: helix-turn-helix transcriptional regulator [Lachnospiraceae bacterium]|nr:helix-turn-helix transcriptional regulator [Lachnospiraceae bacterium]